MKPPAPSSGDSSSRRGVATAYMVRWEASGDYLSSGCGEVKPRLSLSCAGEGELNPLNVTGSDNANCVSMNGTLSCAPTKAGLVYIECRDGRASNSTSRKLVTTLESDPVACVADASKTFPLSWTYHLTEVMTYCSDNWTNRGVDCSGKLLNTTSGSTVCYGDDVAPGPVSQPESISASAENFETCIFVAT